MWLPAQDEAGQNSSTDWAGLPKPRPDEELLAVDGGWGKGHFLWECGRMVGSPTPVCIWAALDSVGLKGKGNKENAG